MLIVIFFILGIVLLTLQTTAIHLLPVWFGQPNLLFLLLIYVSLRFDIYRGVAFAFFIGWNIDIISGVYLGLYPVVYTLIFAAIKWLQRHLALDEPLYLPALVAIGYLTSSCAIYVAANLLAPDIELSWPGTGIALQMVILAVIVVPCFSFFSWLHHLSSSPLRLPELGKKQSNRFKN
jgi:rod shape-determining protein MreD